MFLSHFNASQLHANVEVIVKVGGGWKKAFREEEPIEGTFDLYSLSTNTCLDQFRFEAYQISELRIELGIPLYFFTKNRDRVPGEDALCMLLYKLAWPRRYCDFRVVFHTSGQRVGRICNALLRFLHDRFGAKMEGLDRERLSDEYLHYMCQAQFAKNGLIPQIWGFLDATVRPCCRPLYFQRACYCGKERVHALKFQSVVAADGMICHLSGPWSGTTHDNRIFKSGLLPQILDELPIYDFGLSTKFGPLTHPMALFADAGYVFHSRLWSPYKDGRRDAQHAAFNKIMSRNRVTVEWGYNMVIQLWKHMDFISNQKIFKSPIGSQYVVAVLLTNCHSCLNGGNQVSSYFGVPVPTVRTYLATLAS
jgi:hypothetical protein